MQKQKATSTEEVKARIRGMAQHIMQEALEDFLGYPKNHQNPSDNARNGHSVMTVRVDSGPIAVHQYRKSDFEPKLIRKRQTDLDDLEDKIVTMYAKGVTTRDIQEILGDIVCPQRECPHNCVN